MTPIYQTSTFAQDLEEGHKGYAYARSSNPTRRVLQENLAALENGNYGICFGSGLAALSALVHLLKPGEEILSGNDIYGGSYRQFRQVYAPMGIESRFVSLAKPEELDGHIRPNTKLLWIETPSNPMLNILDIAELCKRAKAKGLLVCVDNTFASPYLQNPLDMGADIVLHSATKYLGGHSDLVHGALICKDKELADRLYFLQNAIGAIPGPQDCFLLLRGIKTLHLRVQRACENTAKLAKFLELHPKVAQVHYPGLPSHPGHELAKKQMRLFGAMLSFSLKSTDFAGIAKFVRSLRYIRCAESLGGVESLIGHPATMTHASLPRQERLALGISDSLLRLSVGIEDVEDLIADLSQALRVL